MFSFAKLLFSDAKKKAVTPTKVGVYCIPPSFEIKKNTVDTGLRRYDDFIFLLR